MGSIKRYTYIALFGFLGFLLQLLVHAVGEMGYIFLLSHDFEKWSFGLSHEALLIVHAAWTYALIVLGVTLGIQQGRHWWRRIYVENMRNLT